MQVLDESRRNINGDPQKRSIDHGRNDTLVCLPMTKRSLFVDVWSVPKFWNI
jgi:hypothetical protein